ncbi:MAG: Ser-Thr-rich GPI-anchored membrane family protein [bacterium]
MNQSFSKIWIIVILVVLIVGGILVWQYFKIPEESPNIKVISPNGGEVWEVNGTYDIRYSTNKVDDSGVAIFLTDQSVSPWKITTIVEDVSPELNHYSWTMPLDTPSGSKYKILITGVIVGATEPYKGTVGLSDESDDYFSITKKETTTWTTYKNEEYGYELRFPQLPNYTFLVNNRDLEHSERNSRDIQFSYEQKDGEEGSLFNMKSLYIQELTSEMKEKITKSSSASSLVNIAGYEAIIYLGLIGYDLGEFGDSQSASVIIFNKDPSFFIRISPSGSEVFEQTLSTFRFSE